MNTIYKHKHFSLIISFFLVICLIFTIIFLTTFRFNKKVLGFAFSLEKTPLVLVSENVYNSWNQETKNIVKTKIYHDTNQYSALCKYAGTLEEWYVYYLRVLDNNQTKFDKEYYEIYFSIDTLNFLDLLK